jgi:mono/diheme cytochrome c family protein
MTRALLAGSIALLAAGRVFADAPDLGSDADRKAGAALYAKSCSQCHGDLGDGAGYAAQHLKPRPRNFTTGKFKIRTTPSGALPTTDDLKRIIHRGMPYSSMPPWPNFTEDELKSLAYYVKSFSPDFAKPDFNVAPLALPKAPKYTKESAEAGRKVYEATGCIKCHGELGRGDGPSARTLVDDLGFPIKPADFTQRYTFRGGPTREDIFRTMTTGLNGTPMPAFGDALKPEERWAITDYIYSLADSDEPGYATLVTAKHTDDPIDLAKGAAAFAAAPVARIPIVGQIMEPGREFHPPVVSVLVQAIYDGSDIAFLVRWNDMSAETAGSNSPALVVPIEEEEAQEGAAAAGAAAVDEWGQPVAAAPAAPADPWGEAEAKPAAAGGAAPAGFSDAVAIQLPLALPSGPRKPYFLFGDATNGVDLWFADLARGSADQYVAKGSAAVTVLDAADVVSSAHYDKGEWSVIFKRSLTAASGVPFTPGGFVPIAFTVWDGGSKERGNKRGLSLWSSLYVEPQAVVSAKGPAIKTGFIVFGLEILIIFWVRRSRAA